MLDLSLGITAYNEEANIGRLLEAVTGQVFREGTLREIFVVASGCTDRTAEIVSAHAIRDQRVTLLVQERREGKASAINLLLSRAAGEVIILESGDTVPEDGALDRLVAPFHDPKVGMAGARPVPVDDDTTFLGFSTNLLWRLHHQIALESPKLGELVAFRGFVRKIPEDTAVDEASIEAIVRDAGFQLRYVPEAVVRNKGPETIGDFIRQRRRIAAGHRHLMQSRDYRVSTHNPMTILRTLAREGPQSPRKLVWTMGAVLLEVAGRLLGRYDYSVRGRNPVVWDVAESTKKLD